jgi:hypothetical protein
MLRRSGYGPGRWSERNLRWCRLRDAIMGKGGCSRHSLLDQYRCIGAHTTSPPHLLLLSLPLCACDASTIAFCCQAFDQALFALRPQNFVEPMVFGKRLNLHPVVVLFALVFWYMMWGLPGAFLSVPIMSVLKILCLNMDNMTAQWFAGLLGARSLVLCRSSRQQTSAPHACPCVHGQHTLMHCSR